MVFRTCHSFQRQGGTNTGNQDVSRRRRASRSEGQSRIHHKNEYLVNNFSCQDIFYTIDSDNSGAINITELLDFLTAIGGDIDKTEVKSAGMGHCLIYICIFQVRDVFHSLDESGDRLIDFQEFQVGFLFIPCLYMDIFLGIFVRAIFRGACLSRSGPVSR